MRSLGVTSNTLLAPTRNHALQALQRLSGKVVPTPVLRNLDLDALCGAQLWLKAENLQHVGAFKARGAYNAISQLPASDSKTGITHTPSRARQPPLSKCKKRFFLALRAQSSTNSSYLLAVAG
ncbi:MAG: pyridoxal-phosphate dependent enzyme [Myxococcales bacterium]|nr:pyridoxal-phosphate dependent enzyme [Myxococcales bacterium]